MFRRNFLWSLAASAIGLLGFRPRQSVAVEPRKSFTFTLSANMGLMEPCLRELEMAAEDGRLTREDWLRFLARGNLFDRSRGVAVKTEGDRRETVISFAPSDELLALVDEVKSRMA